MLSEAFMLFTHSLSSSLLLQLLLLLLCHNMPQLNVPSACREGS